MLEKCYMELLLQMIHGLVYIAEVEYLEYI